MKVFKFGGASVKDASGVKNMTDIISKANGNMVVVLSAMGKMTNAFEDLIKAYFNKDKSTWEKVAKIKDYHNTIIEQLFEESHAVNSSIETLYEKIDARLKRIPSMDYDFEYDQLVCFGELLSTTIVSAYLNKKGIQNRWMDIRFLLKTNNRWRHATVDFPLTETLMTTAFDFEKESLYITQGFIGSTTTDLSTTLGREGSDFTAAVIGNILNAEEVAIWKDVPGILNADPQYFNHPQKIDRMSYREAVELTFFGAKVIHPKTIKPLHDKNIPLHVCSFLKPKSSGTIIDSEGSIKSKHQLPVFIMKVNQVLITVSQPDFSFMDEKSLSWIFGTFSELEMKINMIQHSALKLSVSIDLPEHGAMDLIERLSDQFEVNYNDHLDLITIRYYTPEAISKEIDHRTVYVEQKTRSIARFLVKSKR
jgi:aspartate kinase